VQLQELASNLDVRVLIVASSTCLTLIIGGARRSGKEQSVLHKLIAWRHELSISREKHNSQFMLEAQRQQTVRHLIKKPPSGSVTLKANGEITITKAGTDSKEKPGK
jgi:hypothetical protein